MDQHDLARAIALAAVAHTGQLDKSGKAYITHPIRVMQKCEPHGETVQVAAVLHDVVEDTWVSLAVLRQAGFPEEVVAAVDALTYRKGQENYNEYVERCSRNRIAILVKLADLEDNSDPRRRFGPGHDALLRKYERARTRLLAALEGPERL